MGFWDYKCEACEYTFEEMHTIANQDVPTTKPCPNCGEMRVIRLFGAPVINLGFRGSTIQSKAPEGFKDVLRRIKKGKGGQTPGIEL